METIGQRFKQIRINEKLSQDEFGATLDMTKSGISAVENNKVFVSVSVLSKLFFDKKINLNWFICGQGSMYNAENNSDLKSEIMSEVEKMLLERGIK